MSMKLSFLGPVGTYSETAALMYKKDEHTLIPEANITEVLSGIENELYDEGILPIENSRIGTIIEVIDYLIKSKSLYINHELLLPIEACLISKKKTTKLNEIKEIISKPEAIGQCNQWISERLRKDIVIKGYPSTAEAVESLKGLPDYVAAIGPERSAIINKNHIIKKGIQDYKNNTTKFVVISKKENKPTGKDKTTIAFDFKISDKAGLLFTALQCFSKRDINLQKIESRPKGTQIGDYIFIIDFDGHVNDKKITEALSELSKTTSFLRVLGSYSYTK